MSSGEGIFMVELGGVDGDDVARAFEAARVRRVRAMRLTIAGHHRPTADFANLVIAELSRSPTIERLVLHHPGLVTRFLVSSIVLAAPTVHVVAETGIEARQGANASPPSSPVPDPQAEGAGGRASSLRWITAEIGGDLAELDELFSRAQTVGARGLVLVLRVDRPLDAALRDAMTDRLHQATWLRALALVHAGAAVGFLASTLSLRAAHVRVRSFPTIGEAEAMLRGM
jgi:hypothetical protein